ncbi:MAG: hypothetical protein ACRDHN_08645, partial [Thermomicrobiales bacterium]
MSQSAASENIAFVAYSQPYTFVEVGTYNWQATYSGNALYPPVVSECGSETVIVDQAQPEIVTTLSRTTISTTESVSDSAVLTGASANAGGTVTYRIYNVLDCKSDPLWELGPYDVVDGVVPDSAPQQFDVAGTYYWMAFYSGDANNAAAQGDCADETMFVEAPSLVITKFPDAPAVNAGETIGFTITLTNQGLGTAFGATVIDPLTTIGWELDGRSSDSSCTLSPDAIVNCGPVDLHSGESLTAYVTATPALEICGPITNTASYSSLNGGEGQSPEATITINCATLSITKVADAASVSLGDQIGYTITLTNEGPGTAFGAHVTDPMSPPWTWTLDAANSSADCEFLGMTLECHARDLANGGTIVAHVVAETQGLSCGTVTNTAYYLSTYSGSGQSDPATIEILCPDLSITKTASAESVSAGDAIQFTIGVTNAGPGKAYGVVVSDQLPAGITWTVDSSTAMSSCGIASGLL